MWTKDDIRGGVSVVCMSVSVSVCSWFVKKINCIGLIEQFIPIYFWGCVVHSWNDSPGAEISQKKNDAVAHAFSSASEPKERDRESCSCGQGRMWRCVCFTHPEVKVRTWNDPLTLVMRV